MEWGKGKRDQRRKPENREGKGVGKGRGERKGRQAKFLKELEMVLAASLPSHYGCKFPQRVCCPEQGPGVLHF